MKDKIADLRRHRQELRERLEQAELEEHGQDSTHFRDIDRLQKEKVSEKGDVLLVDVDEDDANNHNMACQRIRYFCNVAASIAKA